MFDFILKLVVGALFLCLGLLIWKKEMIQFIHSYHHKKVNAEDKKAYTKMIGGGLIAIGSGLIVFETIDRVTKVEIGGIGTIISLITGFIIMHKAQKKYNGSWFS